MERWEYSYIRTECMTPLGRIMFLSNMDDHGKKGWEAISVSHFVNDGTEQAVAYFKRRVKGVTGR